MLPVNDSHVGSKSNAESLLWTGGRKKGKKRKGERRRRRRKKEKRNPSNAESLLWTGGRRKAKASLRFSTGTLKEFGGGGRERNVRTPFWTLGRKSEGRNAGEVMQRWSSGQECKGENRAMLGLLSGLRKLGQHGQTLE